MSKYNLDTLRKRYRVERLDVALVFMALADLKVGDSLKSTIGDVVKISDTEFRLTCDAEKIEETVERWLDASTEGFGGLCPPSKGSANKRN